MNLYPYEPDIPTDTSGAPRTLTAATTIRKVHSPVKQRVTRNIAVESSQGDTKFNT